jgi:hypothetical protein
MDRFFELRGSAKQPLQKILVDHWQSRLTHSLHVKRTLAGKLPVQMLFEQPINPLVLVQPRICIRESMPIHRVR